MPNTTAASIISKARITLQDLAAVRWTDAELLGYLNDGQREICMLRPDACAVVASMPLVAGTRQQIPDAGTAILKVVRNMGSNGTTPGRAIRHVLMDTLDSNIPNWHTVSPAAEILHAMTDARMPQFFYVYPPAATGTQVEVVYAAPPGDVAALGDTINVDDVFSTPLLDYVLFRAYTKDQDIPNGTERATAHRALFDAAMNGKAQADAVVAPKANPKG